MELLKLAEISSLPSNLCGEFYDLRDRIRACESNPNLNCFSYSNIWTFSDSRAVLCMLGKQVFPGRLSYSSKRGLDFRRDTNAMIGAILVLEEFVTAERLFARKEQLRSALKMLELSLEPGRAEEMNYHIICSKEESAKYGMLTNAPPQKEYRKNFRVTELSQLPKYVTLDFETGTVFMPSSLDCLDTPSLEASILGK